MIVLHVHGHPSTLNQYTVLHYRRLMSSRRTSLQVFVYINMIELPIHTNNKKY